ncbi:MAG TPA: response regulator [Bryobacteraceae bacterium]|nr:response regulator [Bryobacteraceae bacterium]
MILLDLNLPKMDGFQVLEAIKGDPELRNIPVVVVSGSDREADISRAYGLQASAFVVKPSEVDEYFAAIRSLKQLWFHAASRSPKPDSTS